jgi:secreted PhoX family phosphatase
VAGTSIGHKWEDGPRGAIGRSELSGACYSPDGQWLFVHLQYPGNDVRDHRALGPGLALALGAVGREREGLAADQPLEDADHHP